MTKKKETQSQKIEKMINAALERHQSTNISHCEFVGAKFDEAATDAITTIAEGLVENAKALGQLAYVLKGSTVEIETMLKIDA